MLIALAAIAAEVAVLILYAVRRANGAVLSPLDAIDARNLILAAMATTSGYWFTQNQDAGESDLLMFVLFGCVLPAQAGAATSRLFTRLSSSAWLIACMGGLAVGTLNQDAAWPWS
ncbi:hypothetical protein [Streptomyces sp. BA2]|uniref:hypothetical protein n=1 Tax=Streptomyces sp. BA2 TaxID=436595 RepID=UPI0013260E33|nr:hypothetical protein [Streptomyces sp. BA2]MWA07952.1 hypothetical protein [Streptomyces sp. BA2]